MSGTNDVVSPDLGKDDYSLERHELFADLELEEAIASIRRQDHEPADDDH